MAASGTVDRREIAQFDALADTWWDVDGPMAPLHAMNPVRLAFIRDCLCRHFDRDADSLRPLTGLRIIDIGCGGGVVSEPLARLGAEVTGIDASAAAIDAARRHADDAGLSIAYRETTAEALAAGSQRFDAVVSMEVVEHVADLAGFVAATAGLARPGGALLLATLNRTARSFALAVVGAEYVLRWLPRGTHDWRRFVRPAELNRLLRHNGVELRELAGVSYDARARAWHRGTDRSVNYLAFGVKDDV